MARHRVPTTRRHVRTVPAWVLLLALAAASCSGGIEIEPDAAPPTPESGAPGEEPTPVRDEPELPVLSDLEAPEWQPSTRTEEVLASIDEHGEATLQDAIDAFGLLAEDLPGTSPSELPIGETLGDLSTRQLIEAFRDELTPEQLAVLDAYVEPGRLVGTIRADGTVELAAPTPAPEEPTPGPSGFRYAGPVPDPIDLQYLTLLGEVEDAWRAYRPDFPTFEVDLFISSSPKNEMTAWPRNGNDPSTCEVTVKAGFFQSGPSDDKIRWFFAHELFHCAQFVWQQGSPAPHWLAEGSADWAAADLFRTTPADYDGLGDQWFTDADAPLVNRSYSAWPLFENARLSGLDPYGPIEAMVTSVAPTAGKILAIGGLDGHLFRMAWSTRTLRSDPLGPTWQLPWPKPAIEFGPHDNLFSHGARDLGTYNITGKGQFTQLQHLVEMTDRVGLVTVTPTGGPLTTQAAAGPATVGDGRSGRFCFASDMCRCPEGSSSEAIPMAGQNMIFSFAAAFGPTVAAVRAEEWDAERECSEDTPTDDGYSNGDPHLVSFDGLPFDVVTLGEFVTARDPQGGFEVQARHEPFRNGAGTTAVALSTGEHRITFTMPDFYTDESPVIRVDGEVTSGAELAVGGVVVSIDGTDALAVWPDGSVVGLHWFLGWFVSITVPSERAARMVGLLGSADDNMANDLIMPDGSFVDTVDAARHESSYALVWSVDADTTLFDYEPGQSVSTFRIPHPDPDPPEISEEDTEDCADALGAMATSHEIFSCAYDVAVTGEADFVDEYVAVVEDRVAGDDHFVLVPEPAATPTPDAPAAPGQLGTPTLTLDDANPAGSLDAIEGTVLVARAHTCGEQVNASIRVSVAGADDLVAVATLCDPAGLAGILADPGEWTNGEAYVWLPGTSTYQIQLESLSFDESVGPVDLFVDPEPVVLSATELAGGDERRLETIADTVVYLADPAAEFAAPAFEQACAVEVYWGTQSQFPRDEPFDLSVCEHSAGINLPPADFLIPIVVFNRTDSPLTVELTPIG